MEKGYVHHKRLFPVYQPGIILFKQHEIRAFSVWWLSEKASDTGPFSFLVSWQGERQWENMQKGRTEKKGEKMEAIWLVYLGSGNGVHVDPSMDLIPKGWSFTISLT